MSDSVNRQTVTAQTLAELSKKVQLIISQGWQADGAPIRNPDGTYSQDLKSTASSE